LPIEDPIYCKNFKTCWTWYNCVDRAADDFADINVNHYRVNAKS